MSGIVFLLKGNLRSHGFVTLVGLDPRLGLPQAELRPIWDRQRVIWLFGRIVESAPGIWHVPPASNSRPCLRYIIQLMAARSAGQDEDTDISQSIFLSTLPHFPGRY